MVHQLRLCCSNLTVSRTSSCTEHIPTPGRPRCYSPYQTNYQSGGVPCQCQHQCNVNFQNDHCRNCAYFINDHTYTILKKMCRRLVKQYNQSQCREKYLVFDGGHSIKIRVHRNSSDVNGCLTNENNRGKGSMVPHGAKDTSETVGKGQSKLVKGSNADGEIDQRGRKKKGYSRKSAEAQDEINERERKKKSKDRRSVKTEDDIDERDQRKKGKKGKNKEEEDEVDERDQRKKGKKGKNKEEEDEVDERDRKKKGKKGKSKEEEYDNEIDDQSRKKKGKRMKSIEAADETAERGHKKKGKSRKSTEIEIETDERGRQKKGKNTEAENKTNERGRKKGRDVKKRSDEDSDENVLRRRTFSKKGKLKKSLPDVKNVKKRRTLADSGKHRTTISGFKVITDLRQKVRSNQKVIPECKKLKVASYGREGKFIDYLRADLEQRECSAKPCPRAPPIMPCYKPCAPCTTCLPYTSCINRNPCASYYVVC